MAAVCGWNHFRRSRSFSPNSVPKLELGNEKEKEAVIYQLSASLHELPENITIYNHLYNLLE
jgi:hypothetical protein